MPRPPFFTLRGQAKYPKSSKPRPPPGPVLPRKTTPTTEPRPPAGLSPLGRLTPKPSLQRQLCPAPGSRRFRPIQNQFCSWISGSDSLQHNTGVGTEDTGIRGAVPRAWGLSRLDFTPRELSSLDQTPSSLGEVAWLPSGGVCPASKTVGFHFRISVSRWGWSIDLGLWTQIKVDSSLGSPVEQLRDSGQITQPLYQPTWVSGNVYFVGLKTSLNED